MDTNQKLKLLIVDDEVDLCKFIQLSLSEDEFDVSYTHCGNKAFQIINENNFDYVLSDIRMDNGDGIELLKNIQSLIHKPKVILMSAYSETKRSELQELGALAVLNKPFEIEELLNLLK